MFGGLVQGTKKQLEATAQHLREKEERKRKQRYVMMNVVKDIKAINQQATTFKDVLKQVLAERKKLEEQSESEDYDQPKAEPDNEA